MDGKKEGEGIVYSAKKTKLATLIYHKDMLDGLLYSATMREQKRKNAHTRMMFRMAGHVNTRMNTRSCL